MNKKIFTVAVAAALLLLPSFSAVADGGEEAMPFTRVPHDPVSLGMGGAGAALTSSMAYSTFRNTAILPYSDQTLDVAASYQMWEPDGSTTHNITVGAGWNINKKIGVALGLTYGAGDKYDIYSTSGANNGTFTPNDIQVNAGFGWKFVDFLSLGGTVKYLHQSLAEDYTYDAVAADIFLMTKLADFTVTAGISSIGGQVEAESGTKYDLPASITVAGGYNHVFGGKHGFDAAVDLDYYYNCSELTAAVGAQYTFKDMVSLRGGYHYGGDSAVPSYGSVGIGGKIIGIRLDAAYVIATGDSVLKNSFCIGLGYSF